MPASWKGCCAGVPQRWVFAVMGCLGIANAAMMQICLALAITRMVKPRAMSSNHTVSDETCPSYESTYPSTISGGTYEWDEYTQGIILSSFFWGYLIMLIPGGIVTETFGGKYTFGLSIFSTATFTLLTPIVVQIYGSTGLIVLRALMGLSGGTLDPAASFLIAQWAPPDERAKIGGMVTSGAGVGNMLGSALSGILIEYSPIGWPIVFYFFGALGILWFFAWVILCYNNPDEHPFISNREKKFFRETMNEHTQKKLQPTPWRQILTSVPVWAMIIGKFGFMWNMYTITTDLPKYVSHVLKFSTKANGLLVAFPHLPKLVFAYLMSWLADWLTKNGKMSRTNVLKVWFSIAMMLPAACIIAASYAGCHRATVVILFTIGLTFVGSSYSSVFLIPNYLSPNYSATIMAIATLVASLAGILVPYVVGLLTPNQTLSEWRIYFWISFLISSLATLIFNLWAEAEVQYWNNPEVRIVPEKEVDVKAELVQPVREKLLQDYPEKSLPEQYNACY